MLFNNEIVINTVICNFRLESPFSALLTTDGGPSPLESQFESAWANLHIEEAAAASTAHTNTINDELTHPYEEKDGYRVHPRCASREQSPQYKTY